MSAGRVHVVEFRNDKTRPDRLQSLIGPVPLHRPDPTGLDPTRQSQRICRRTVRTQRTLSETRVTVREPGRTFIFLSTKSGRARLVEYGLYSAGWLGSRVVSVLHLGAEAPGFKSQPRRCRVTVLGKLFTPVVPLFTKQRNW